MYVSTTVDFADQVETGSGLVSGGGLSCLFRDRFSCEPCMQACECWPRLTARLSEGRASKSHTHKVATLYNIYTGMRHT